MEAKEIRALIKAIKAQRKLALSSIKSDLSKEQMHYVKEGMKIAYDDCIFILNDELDAIKGEVVL